MKENDRKYLDAYPKCNSFYFTGDGLVFFNKDEAQKHRDTLRGNEKVIRELHRSENKQNNSK